MASTVPAAQIIASMSDTWTFSSQSNSVSFAAGSPGSSTSTTQGLVLGPNVSGTPSASASNFVANMLSAGTTLNMTAGPGSSFGTAVGEAFSGVVRITNTGSTVDFLINYNLFYSIQALGPDFASASGSDQFEKFDTQVQDWVTFGVTSNGVG